MITTFFLFKNITSAFIIINYNCKHVNYNKHYFVSCKEKHNQHIADEQNFSDCYVCNELDAVKDGKNDDFYELTIVTYEERCGSTMFD